MSDQEIRDIWDALNEIRSALANVATTLAALQACLNERCVERGNRLASMESKISEMQHKIWFFSGAAAVIGALASWVFKK